MLSKEEIEEAKRNCKRVLETDPLKSTIDFQYNDVDNLLEYIEELEQKVENKDNKVKRIIKRLDNDIKNITKTKEEKKKFPNYLDDYTKCRLKAYRTKTKEIKEYIEKEYFNII